MKLGLLIGAPDSKPVKKNRRERKVKIGSAKEALFQRRTCAFFVRYTVRSYLDTSIKKYNVHVKTL